MNLSIKPFHPRRTTTYVHNCIETRDVAIVARCRQHMRSSFSFVVSSVACPFSASTRFFVVAWEATDDNSAESSFCRYGMLC